jgi:glycosyltransferase involved in cell wall biosynthesis
MRVLHVHSGNLYGGVETFLATLARCRQFAPSMDTTVALCFDGAIGIELRDLGVRTPLLGAVRLRRPLTIWRARRALRSLLRRERFDVVVCHQAWPLAIFGPVVKRASLPLVSWIHTAQRGTHWLDRLAGRVAPDCIICNSRFTASLQRTDSRIETIYYPVLAAVGQPSSANGGAPQAAGVRVECDTPADAVVIVQVSRMERLKGQTVCLDALGMLGGSHRWVCWQVGGAQRAEEAEFARALRAQAEHLGIADRIRFLGHRVDVMRLLNEADIFCQPNLEPEGFGISFVEALAVGIPVVSSAIGGPLEIVDDSCGALVPAGDSAALASVLGRLIEDDAARKALGVGGPPRARALCDPATQLPRIAAVLESVACAGVH